MLALDEVRSWGKIARRNYEFIQKNCPEVLEACDDLVNTALNEWFVKYFLKGLSEEELRDSVMAGNLLHLIAPLPSYVCTAVLHGAVMVAHLILRELIEGTASALYADLKYYDLPHEEKVNKLRQKYFCQLLGELKEVVGEELVNEVKEVWNETSSRAHTTATKKGDGPLSKAIKYIEEHGAPPSYLAIPLPTTYELPESDIEELKELTKTPNTFPTMPAIPASRSFRQEQIMCKM